MEPRYVIILDFCIGALNIIRLTDDEVKESGKYDDFEEYLSTLGGQIRLQVEQLPVDDYGELERLLV